MTLPLLLALVRALREAEIEPVCVTLALPLRVAEPLPLAVSQGIGVWLAVGDGLPTPVPSGEPVLAGLPLKELLKVAVGAALAEARPESVALCVAVCVAHVLPLRVGSELALGELEDEAQDVAEVLCVESMELLRDGVLPSDSVCETNALRVSAEGELDCENKLDTEPLPLEKGLSDSDCVEHGEAVSEAVVEWLSLGAREELPEGLSEGACEAQTLALGDTLLPRLLLGQGEADAEGLLLRLTLKHCEAVAEATPLPLAEPRGEGEGASVPVPGAVTEAHGEDDSQRVARGLPVKPLGEDVGEGALVESDAETQPLAEKLDECV